MKTSVIVTLILPTTSSYWAISVCPVMAALNVLPHSDFTRSDEAGTVSIFI